MQAATAAWEDVYNPKHYTLLIAAAATDDHNHTHNNYRCDSNDENINQYC